MTKTNKFFYFQVEYVRTKFLYLQIGLCWPYWWYDVRLAPDRDDGTMYTYARFSPLMRLFIRNKKNWPEKKSFIQFVKHYQIKYY